MRNNALFSQRRGISSIIGTFIFLILMFAAFGAILVAFQFQTELISAQRTVTDIEIRKAQENFSIDPDRSNGKLVVNVFNKGAKPVEIVDVWYVRKTPDFDANLVAVTPENSFVPPSNSRDVMGAQGPTIADGSWQIKAVTALGTTVTEDISFPEGGGKGGKNLQDVLIAQPAVYVAFPNPIVKLGGKQGYFALIIGNPTDNDMTVYRASLQLITPENPGNFDTGSSAITCDPPIATCTSDWKEGGDYFYWDGTPFTVLAHTAVTLPALVEIGQAAGNTPIITINTNVWSSFGQFGSTKTDTLSATKEAGKHYAIPNIYLVDPASANPNSPVYYVSGVTGSKEFNVRIKNTGTTSGTIDKGSVLIMNIPYPFKIESKDPVSADFDPIDVPTFKDDDGNESYQIRATLKQSIDVGAFKTYKFTVKANPAIQKEELRLFYMFASGYTSSPDDDPPTTDKKLIGPVAEIVVQACPPSGC